MRHRKIPEMPCPHCGAQLDGCFAASNNPDEWTPCSGDLSICGECGTLLVFGDNGFSLATEQDANELDEKYRIAFEMAYNKPVVVRDLFMTGRTRKLPELTCPHCHIKLNACTAAHDDPERWIPKDGSLMICCYCGTACQIWEDGLKFATRDVFEKLPEHVKVAFESAFKMPLVARESED